jgi:hypothetical protein
MLEFRNAEHSDIKNLMDDLHPIQILEVNASHGEDIPYYVSIALDKSKEAYVAYDDGYLLAMFGIIGNTVLSDNASPWMLSTTQMQRHPKQVLRTSRNVINLWTDQHKVLYNFIDARYTQSINWARKLGFKIHPAIPYGLLKLPFHMIEKRSGY